MRASTFFFFFNDFFPFSQIPELLLLLLLYNNSLSIHVLCNTLANTTNRVNEII